jgi:hypothetical protein
VTASPFLWLYGASGVGKSTLGWELFRQLSAANVNGAYVDADQLGLCYPLTPDDHFNHHLKAANLAAAWQGHHAAGAKYLIVSGFVATADEIGIYAEAVPDTTLTVCRLHAGPATLKARYLGRGSLTELLPDALRDAEELDQGDKPGVRVLTDGLSPAELARQLCGPGAPWPMLPPLHVPPRQATSDV